MFRLKFSNVLLFGTVGVFGVISKVIFEKIYATSDKIVDEEFHLSLGIAYCKYEFNKWHPKITTFPGLYLLSSLLLGPFDLCSAYWLRFISQLFSLINICLFYILLNINNNDPSWKNLISAINLALLPPLYFFSHVYYTDVTSLTMILLLFIFSQTGHHYLASIFGMFAVLFRQTNIIWVGMAAGCYILRGLNAIIQNKPSLENTGVTSKELFQFVKIFQDDLLSVLKKTKANFWLNVASYMALLVAFILFIYFNGSIVVGDKTAHEATIHLPQLFYFCLFSLVFAWPYFVTEIFNFVRVTKHHKIVTFMCLLTSLAIVYFNTLVHPYILADNRHYVFYVWNRFYGRYSFFRYLMVPIYLFSLFVIVKKLWRKKDVSFLLCYFLCTLVVLITQRLLEFRYFFIPFVLFRTQLRNISGYSLIYEFISHCIITACTLYLFFTKTINWVDFDYPQRLIW